MNYFSARFLAITFCFADRILYIPLIAVQTNESNMTESHDHLLIHGQSGEPVSHMKIEEKSPKVNKKKSRGKPEKISVK